MANAEHLELIKQGVDVWNHWRLTNQEIQPDLSGAELEEADLQGINLENVNLKDAMLFDVNFQKANLRNADLQGANVYEAVFTYADLKGANLLKADGLTRYHFEAAIFDETTKIPDYVDLGKEEKPEVSKIAIFLIVIALVLVAFLLWR